MKNFVEIQNATDNINTFNPSEYPGMTYEQGVEEALMWVLEQIDDSEFIYSKIREK